MVKNSFTDLLACSSLINTLYNGAKFVKRQVTEIKASENVVKVKLFRSARQFSLSAYLQSNGQLNRMHWLRRDLLSVRRVLLRLIRVHSIWSESMQFWRMRPLMDNILRQREFHEYTYIWGWNDRTESIRNQFTAYPKTTETIKVDVTQN